MTKQFFFVFLIMYMATMATDDRHCVVFDSIDYYIDPERDGDVFFDWTNARFSFNHVGDDGSSGIYQCCFPSVKAMEAFAKKYQAKLKENMPEEVRYPLGRWGRANNLCIIKKSFKLFPHRTCAARVLHGNPLCASSLSLFPFASKNYSQCPPI